jgi:phosphoglycolate phosphatase-like HAD superfamily hydrolase
MGRVVARVRALLPGDWFGAAGSRFRKTTDAIAELAEEQGVRPQDLVADGIRKVKGLANAEYAAAMKNFAEAEQKQIETEVMRRTVEARVRKEFADARAAEIKALDAEIELLKKLNEAGVVLGREKNGNLIVVVAPPNLDLTLLRKWSTEEDEPPRSLNTPEPPA